MTEAQLIRKGFEQIGPPLPENAGCVLAITTILGRPVAMCEGGPYRLNKDNVWAGLGTPDDRV